MINKKTYLLLVMILCFLFSDVFAFDWTQCEEKTFVVTAYYSPLAGQAFYYKDSFVKEKRLNGEWKHGASGKKVFNGMLAAPSGYDFGGKIYFPQLWVGEIADRGGAIVKAWERRFQHDRIDIWMWYGEKWLVRALDFGVQTYKWRYCTADDLNVVKNNNIKVWFDLKKIPLFEHFFDLAIWKQSLWPDTNRKDVWVYTLQKYLVKLWYLKKIYHTWFFGKETKKALCRYQTDKKISYPAHIHCGVFGARTRFAMKKDVEKKGLLPQSLWSTTNIANIIQSSKSRDEAEKIINKQTKEIDYFDKPFYKNSFDEKVLKMQRLLVDVWLFDGDPDGVYDDKTIAAVYQFQIKEWILKWVVNENNLAGYVWPKTREALNNKLKQKIEKERLVALEELLAKDIVKKNLERNKNIFKFYRAYTKNEWPNEEIRILQRFLEKLELYDAAINGVYDVNTVNSVYDFQLKYWVLTKDSHYTLHGFLWPGTRKKINEMIRFGG